MSDIYDTRHLGFTIQLKSTYIQSEGRLKKQKSNKQTFERLIIQPIYQVYV